MSFPDRAESLRAKAHLSGVRMPVLVGVTALGLLVLVAAGILAFNALSPGSFSVDKVADAARDATVQEGSEAPAAVARTIMVHVSGAVAVPGVQELAEGSRVQDAIEAAGGFAEGASSDALNLARVLTDGEQVIVPLQAAVDEAASASAGNGAPGGTATGMGGKVNINTASEAELDALPGVGPSTASKIVAEREANGPFATVEDLKRVSGIGDKKYEALVDAICVG